MPVSMCSSPRFRAWISTATQPWSTAARAALEKGGTLIRPYDLQIAAHALALGLVLISDNVREFRRVGR